MQLQELWKCMVWASREDRQKIRTQACHVALLKRLVRFFRVFNPGAGLVGGKREENRRVTTHSGRDIVGGLASGTAEKMWALASCVWQAGYERTYACSYPQVIESLRK